MKLLKALARGLAGAESFVLVTVMAIMVIAVFTQVLNRNVFAVSIPGLDEIAVYSMIYLVMLGTEAGLRDGSQVSVHLLRDRLVGRGRNIVEIIAKTVVVVFAGFLSIASFDFVTQQINRGQTSAGLGMPMWITAAAFLIAFVAIFVVQITELFALVYAAIKDDQGLAKAIETESFHSLEAIDQEKSLNLDSHAKSKDGA